MSYAELLCRTHYSFLQGASHPHEIVDRAGELGLAAVGITDRDGVYGIPKAYRAVRLREEAGLNEPRLIVGSDVRLAGGLPRLRLLARDRAAYGVMCRILTRSHADKPKGEASLRLAELDEELKRLGAQGLIAVPEEGAWDPEALAVYRDRFTADRLFLPLSRFLDGRDVERVRATTEAAKRFGLRCLATNEVHFHTKERKPLHDLLTGVRENTPLPEIGYRVFSNCERRLKSPAEMARLFRDHPDALKATLDIADSCTFSPRELRYRYPSEWIPPEKTAQGWLEELTWKGAEWRYSREQGGSGVVPADVRKQLEHELSLIQQLQFADYFLTIWDIVEYARSRAILCQGRGSAANSAVCYCLGITAIDPVRMNLLFERFLSVERGEPPDIDVDFEHERREEVLQYVYTKYGRDRAGMVAALITYRSKSAIRDLGKALGLPVVETEGAAAVTKTDPRLSRWVEEIRSFPRHLSIHSGGFTLSADPLIETVPVEPARMEGRTIVQWDKEDLAEIGLLKVDLLSLGMLSALRKAFDLVRPKRELTLATVPPDDKPTYAMIQRAETVGVFQIESRAQMSMLRRLKPENFYDLVIEIAIVRPGPIQGQMVHPYLKRRRGEEPVTYPHPKLEAILGRTLGVPLFQEQVMKIAVAIAGFTAGEADELRRAIGAWRSSGTIDRMGRKLRDGLLREGLPPDWVERVFQQIKGFAEYGFPESHSASFTVLAYASCYLKHHYPAEFTIALINSQPMGFYGIHTLLEEAQRSGVRVLPIDPNLSEWDCTWVAGEKVSDTGNIRLGWRVVSGLSETLAKVLIAERTRQPFASLSDFLARTRLGPQVLERLAMGNGFAAFGLEQREALWCVLGEQVISRLETPAQLGFGFGLGAASAPASSANLFPALTAWETIQAEYTAFGTSVHGHPMRALREQMPDRVPRIDSQKFKTLSRGKRVWVSGLVIVRQRPHTAKGVCFATLEDEQGFFDLIFHEPVYEKYRGIFRSTAFLRVYGEVQRDPKDPKATAMSLLVSRVEPLFTETRAQALRVQSYDFH